MAKFRKKPIVIEAFQFTKTCYTPDWFIKELKAGRAWFQDGNEPYYTIETLEGEMKANLGDYIIKGIKGECYPCKPEIFKATYEPIYIAGIDPYEKTKNNGPT
jgi:hypothetical protein